MHLDNNYIVGKSYNIKLNVDVGKWTGIFVGINIYNQLTFKISDTCDINQNKKCPFFNNKTITDEIIDNEPLYKNCCLCQFVCIQNDDWQIV